MIRINLLRSVLPTRSKRSPKKAIVIGAIGFAVILIAMGAFFVLKPSSHGSETQHATPLIRMAKRLSPVHAQVETPFDVVEDIVDDINGGRFKIKELNRLSSPSHLSPIERKLFERLFVRNAFLVFNSAIRPGMGFNTISLDAEGAFFIFGVAPDESSAMAFQQEVKGSPEEAHHYSPPTPLP